MRHTGTLLTLECAFWSLQDAAIKCFHVNEAGKEFIHSPQHNYTEYDLSAAMGEGGFSCSADGL